MRGIVKIKIIPNLQFIFHLHELSLIIKYNCPDFGILICSFFSFMVYFILESTSFTWYHIQEIILLLLFLLKLKALSKFLWKIYSTMRSLWGQCSLGENHVFFIDEWEVGGGPDALPAFWLSHGISKCHIIIALPSPGPIWCSVWSYGSHFWQEIDFILLALVVDVHSDVPVRSLVVADRACVNH